MYALKIQISINYCFLHQLVNIKYMTIHSELVIQIGNHENNDNMRTKLRRLLKMAE